MRVRDGLDEREAEAGARAAGARRAAEALERARQVVRGEAVAVIGHVQLDEVAVGAGRDADRHGAVAPRVVDQVGQRAVERVGVGEHAQVRIDGLLDLLDAEALDHARHQRRERDLLQVARRAALLAAGDQQQVLGELREAVGLLSCRDEREAPVARLGVGVQRDLDLGLEDRQRGAQLMARGGQELALVARRGVEPVEHVVERLAQPPQLVLGRRERQPCPGGHVGDLRRAATHPLDRPERARGDRVARAPRRAAARSGARSAARRGASRGSSRAGASRPPRRRSSPPRRAAQDAGALADLEADLTAPRGGEMHWADHRRGVVHAL